MRRSSAAGAALRSPFSIGAAAAAATRSRSLARGAGGRVPGAQRTAIDPEHAAGSAHGLGRLGRQPVVRRAAAAVQHARVSASSCGHARPAAAACLPSRAERTTTEQPRPRRANRPR